MIWTIMPEDGLFDEVKHELRTVQYNGRRLLVDTFGQTLGEGQIVRLLSTNPADFLSPDFMPGKSIPIR